MYLLVKTTHKIKRVRERVLAFMPLKVAGTPVARSVKLLIIFSKKSLLIIYQNTIEKILFKIENKNVLPRNLGS